MMLTELLELIADTAEKNCSLGTEISLEELPKEKVIEMICSVIDRSMWIHR